VQYIHDLGVRRTPERFRCIVDLGLVGVSRLFSSRQQINQCLGDGKTGRLSRDFVGQWICIASPSHCRIQQILQIVPKNYEFEKNITLSNTFVQIFTTMLAASGLLMASDEMELLRCLKK
jgi:hypothetical protein